LAVFFKNKKRDKFNLSRFLFLKTYKMQGEKKEKYTEKYLATSYTKSTGHSCFIPKNIWQSAINAFYLNKGLSAGRLLYEFSLSKP
jgi:hypothetical protein